MNGSTSTGTGDIHSEFSKILNDFSHFLSKRKKNKNTFLPISDESQAILDSWGQSRNKETGTKDEFLFQGPGDAKIFIIDSDGCFFEGGAGNLLVKILGAMKLSAENVFICNFPNSRSVHKKIKAVSPRIIITLGEKAGRVLLNMNQPLEQFQGKFHEYCGIRVMPTFHPSLLLQQPQFKRQVWDDMKQVMVFAGLGNGS